MPPKLTSITLTTPQLIDAIEALDGPPRLPTRTLATWANGLVPPSISHPRRRGRYNARVYSLGDLARARLVVHLTRRKHLSLAQVRAILKDHGTELQRLLHPVTGRKVGALDDVLVLRASGWSAAVVRGKDADRLLGTGEAQQLLPLADVAVDESVLQIVRRIQAIA